MTLLKDRLDAAGVDTASARLAALSVRSLQECDGSVALATEALWRALSKEPWVAKEALLKPVLIERLRDMTGEVKSGTNQDHKTDKPRAAAPVLVSSNRRNTAPNPERRRAVQEIVRKAVEVIRFKHLTADGRDWAVVGAHELSGMARDGKLAAAIREHLGSLSNSQQVKPIGELISAATFNKLRASLEP